MAVAAPKMEKLANSYGDRLKPEYTDNDTGSIA
jgi:peptide-methionine (S)-S-oxide reductase